MPGFQYRYRLGGTSPTFREFAVTGAGVRDGDMLSSVDGKPHVGASAARRLMGVAVGDGGSPPGGRTVRVIVDDDEVYAVVDPNARLAGACTGAQGVGDGADDLLVVVVGSGAGEETLVRIGQGRHDAGATQSRLTGGELNAALSRVAVRTHREHAGRGPSRAQSFHHGNVVVVVLHDALTTAERGLVEQGRTDLVLEFRRAFQEVMRESLVTSVERLTGRRVEAFMSANNLDPDVAAEVFVLDRPVVGEPELAAARGSAR